MQTLFNPAKIPPATEKRGLDRRATVCRRLGENDLVTRPQAAPADPSQHRSDLALVQAALARQPRAIDRLIERLECVPRILAAINQELSSPLNPHDIEDLSQDTLIVIMKKLELFEGRARLETWVYRFCYLELMNRVRREARRSTQSIDAEPDPPGPEQALPDTGQLERVEQCLEELGPPKSHVIQLRHFEEMTFGEIGQVLDMPANTAKTHYHRGLSWLRGRIRDVCGGRGA